MQGEISRISSRNHRV
jgi:hypothetical protein